MTIFGWGDFFINFCCVAKRNGEGLVINVGDVVRVCEYLLIYELSSEWSDEAGAVSVNTAEGEFERSFVKSVV